MQEETITDAKKRRIAKRYIIVPPGQRFILKTKPVSKNIFVKKFKIITDIFSPAFFSLMICHIPNAIPTGIKHVANIPIDQWIVAIKTLSTISNNPQ